MNQHNEKTPGALHRGFLFMHSSQYYVLYAS